MDNSQFINTYIDVILNTTHNQINEVVQLKTQLKMAEIVIAQLQKTIEQNHLEKDAILTDFDTKSKTIAKKNDEIRILNERIVAISKDMDGYRQKASHVDTLTKQISDMKIEIKTLRETKKDVSLPAIGRVVMEANTIGYALNTSFPETEKDDF